MAFDARDCHGVGSGDTFTNLKHLVIGKHSNIMGLKQIKTQKGEGTLALSIDLFISTSLLHDSHLLVLKAIFLFSYLQSTWPIDNDVDKLMQILRPSLHVACTRVQE